jgi:predicted Zn-dependent peptidase
MHARIDKKGIETQREVVKEERRQRIDNTPYGTVLEQIMKRAYQQHPYKWPVIGYMEHIDAATEQDFIDFYKTFYVPNNAILTIAGDIDIPTTKALINQYFADIPRGKTPINRNVGTEPPLQAQVKDVVQDNIRLPAVILAYRTPERNSPDYYVVDLLSQLLSQGKSSRLSKALVDEQQLSLYVGAFPMGLEQPSITVMYAIANVGTTAETLEEALYAQIERVKNELITDKELQKLKNQVENNLVNAKSSVADIARELAHHYMYTGNTHLINTEIEKYLSITAQDLQKAAQKYFNKQNSVVLYYLPKNQ